MAGFVLNDSIDPTDGKIAEMLLIQTWHRHEDVSLIFFFFKDLVSAERLDWITTK